MCLPVKNKVVLEHYTLYFMNLIIVGRRHPTSIQPIGNGGWGSEEVSYWWPPAHNQAKWSMYQAPPTAQLFNVHHLRFYRFLTSPGQLFKMGTLLLFWLCGYTPKPRKGWDLAPITQHVKAEPQILCSSHTIKTGNNGCGKKGHGILGKSMIAPKWDSQEIQLDELPWFMALPEFY